jgi:hypothetical protein
MRNKCCRHSGENFDELMKKRENQEMPLHMSDASNSNTPKSLKVVSCNCLAHAIRKFQETETCYPKESGEILEEMRKAYENEKECCKQGFSKTKRLRYHKKHTSPVFKALHAQMKTLKDDRHVEPNSSLGGAIEYALNHWDKLTMFLKKSGAPLDNNDAERTLKQSIILRKNSLFFKTENGAKIGGALQSMIETTCHAGVNVYDYLVQIVKHKDNVKQDPSSWLPWNYQDALPDDDEA